MSKPDDRAKVDQDEYNRMMADKPVQLNASDAIVEQDKDRAANAASKVWDSLRTFYRAPCLQPSVGIGAAGGFGIGALRYMGGAGGMPAFTWGSTVAGLLAATSWYTCRRAMYARVHGESDLITRMQGGDREALQEYHRRLEERQQKAMANSDEKDKGSWARKA